MAYSGTTAATSLSNPPIQLARGVGNIVNQSGAVAGSTAQPLVGGCGLWFYSSTDGTTLLQGTAYFTDGAQLGMRNGDILINVASTAVGSTTGGMGIGVLLTTNSTAGFNVGVGWTIQIS